MSTQTVSTGNGASHPITADEWQTNAVMQELAREVVRAVAITERVINVVDQLSVRLEAIEKNHTVAFIAELPQPTDFDIELEEAAAEAPEPAPTTVLAEEQAQVDQLAEERFHVTVQQAQLSEALSAICKILPRSTVVPALGCVKLEATDGALVLSASDGETTIQRVVRADISGMGMVFVRGRMLAEAVKQLGSVNVELSIREESFVVSAGGSSVMLPTQVVEQFPNITDYKEGIVGAVGALQLKQMLELTVYASVTDSRGSNSHYTNGVLLHFKDNNLDIVATDGHRLALKRLESIGSRVGEHGLLVPADTCKLLLQLTPEDNDLAVSIFKSGQQVVFEIPGHNAGKRVLKYCGRTVLSSSLIDVKYPDFERIIPKQCKTKVVVNREALQNACKRALLAHGKQHNPVALLESSNGALVVSAEPVNAGKVTAELECDGGSIKTALNPAYICDVLKALSCDKVQINWQSDTEPVVITAPEVQGFVYIQMPVRVD